MFRGDADDVYFEARHYRIYGSCGSATVDVFLRGDAGYNHNYSSGEPRGVS